MKEVAEIIATMGDQGKEAFIWWLITKYATTLTTVFACLIIPAQIITRIGRAIGRTEQ